jgi:succinoglycan biosynthesis protein ExoL
MLLLEDILDPGMNVKIVYFVHDLSDAAVYRRMRMLSLGGATVVPIGFRRSLESKGEVAGMPAIELGLTFDGRLARRAMSVVGSFARLDRIAGDVRGANVVLARNLEMLALAVRARNLYAPSATLAYECLDIHSKLLSNGLDGRLLRRLESKLWNQVDLLLTSSPAFLRNYFAPRGFRSPIRLVENKVLPSEEIQRTAPPPRPPPGPPWRIGWFGAIRCRKSLNILSSLSRAADGRVEVMIRGRPSGASLPDFDRVIAKMPWIRFAGPYRSPADLPNIYGDVHFNWSIDYYESGQNSAWLLPNRIYEGSLHGAVPLALAGVETARWLSERNVGVVLQEPLERHLMDFFQHLDLDTFSDLANRVSSLPREDLEVAPSECCALVDALCAP